MLKEALTYHDGTLFAETEISSKSHLSFCLEGTRKLLVKAKQFMT